MKPSSSRSREMPGRINTASLCLAVVLWLGLSAPAGAQVLDPNDPIAGLSGTDITESLISMNNFTSTPGFEGLNLNVDAGSTQPLIKYSRFSIQIPISIETPIEWMNVYTDIGYGSLNMDDRFNTRTGPSPPAQPPGFEPVAVAADRTIDSGRLGIGLEFLPTKELHIIPYVVWSMSSMRSNTRTNPPLDLTNATPEELVLLANWKSAAWSLGGALDIKYLRWFREDKNRLDLDLKYAIGWAATFNESLPALKTGDWRNTLSGEAIWRSITPLTVFKKHVAWNVFTNAGGFPGQEVDDLGFNYYFGFGAGIDLYIPERLWGKIGRNFIGVRGSGIVGNNLRGWSFTLHMRN